MSKVIFNSQNSRYKEETRQSHGYKYSKLSCNSNYDMKKMIPTYKPNPQSDPCPSTDNNAACNKYLSLREYKEWKFLVEIY